MEIIQARPAIIKLIEEVSNNHKFNDFQIIDVKTNAKGEGYLGEIFLITIKNAVGEETLDIVIKAAFTNEKIRSIIQIAKVFQNEIYFYNDIYPEYLKLEAEHDVIGKAQIVPRFLAKNDNELEEMLVLENLRKSGFDMIPKKTVLDKDHIKLMFETYARFHAYSYVLRDQNPEKYSEIAAVVPNIYKELMDTVFVDGILELVKLVEKVLIPGEDDPIIETFQAYVGKGSLKIFLEAVTEIDDYCCFIHGDSWSNNMMCKYQNEKPIALKLLDFQLIKLGSPACDLSYCLYSGSSKDIFDNLNDYLQIYHKAFSHYVRRLGSDPDKLYPFSVLKEHWKKYAKFGFLMGLMIVKIKLTVQEDLIDFTDVEVFDENLEDVMARIKYDVNEFNTRCRHVMQHLLEIDAL